VHACMFIYAKQREPTHVHACMFICKAASMHWRTGDERKAENRPPRGCWGRAIFARSCARTRSPISSSSIELLYMKMRDNIPANWRTCMGALQTRARAKKDPQEGQKRPRDTSTVCADISSETKPTCAHLCKTLRLGYIYPPPILVRVRESAIADYAPQACLCSCFEKTQVHKQALTRKRVRALTQAAGKW
jgi:hypothetical protein